MRAKLSVLRACFRVLKPGGRIGHYTIYSPPDLDEAGKREMTAFWPAAATRGRWHGELLEATGFVDVRERDVTPAYEATVHRWLEGRKRRHEGLRKVLDEEQLNAKIAENEGALEKIAAGLLKRSFVTGQRP